jgi:diadenylate cyclase
MSFLNISFLDILDIFLVTILFYQVYMLIRGTVAINIFIGIFTVYLLWLLVKALNMQLLGNILGQVMGVGVIALIIVFQQELRHFFLLIGTKYFTNRNFALENIFSPFIKKNVSKLKIVPIVTACRHMALTKTGALIVIKKTSDLSYYVEMGEEINADITSRLIESIFYKNNPLHDGAMIINGDKIQAVSCVLPVSEKLTIPKKLGLRHRAALGISETADCFVVIVSEERGLISYAQYGELTLDISPSELTIMLEKEFSDNKEAQKHIIKSKQEKYKSSELTAEYQ